MSIGKRTRMARLIHPVSGRSIIIPMDHGATLGPLPGLVTPSETIGKLCLHSEQVQGIVLHRGVMEHATRHLSAHDLPARILHLSASTAISLRPTEKALVASVEDAIRMGADAVSIHVNLGVTGEADMLRDFGHIASRCQQWGMPLLAMMYTRIDGQLSHAAHDIASAARLAAEMGADMVKVGYPGSAQAMQEVVDGCFIPVLIAGGEKHACVHDALEMVRHAIAGGAGGICMGRNLFQQDNATAFMADISRIVHGDVAGFRMQNGERHYVSSL